MSGNQENDEIKLRTLTLKVGDHLYKRIEKHLNLLRHREFENKTKQKWITEAIKEKLKSEIEAEEIPRDRRLTVKVDKRLSTLLEERVKFHKKYRSSYSKKQWLLEAIQDKLERDEKEAKNAFRELHSKLEK